jgi:murein L,D-transpeptidase YafK
VQRWLVLVLGVALAAGCARVAPQAVAPTSPFDGLPAPDPMSIVAPPFLPWAASESYVIVVDKPSRMLALYHHGAREKLYPVVLGRMPGRKVYEGDRRTPSGLYRVKNKRSHYRFHRFLDIDYPNRDDLALHRASVAAGKVPAVGKRHKGPGGLLGIHGSDEEELTRVGVNWTYGCVALANADIEELYRVVPEGALVVIRD